jgi:ABC-type bacteriocin/lantibiotic exporter with double-glycine peptidase domain
MHGNDQPKLSGGPRENLLAVVMTLLVAGVFAVFLLVVTGGLLLQIIGVLLLMIVVGCVHFQIWGRTLSQQTAGEREEAILQEKLDQPEWEQPGPRNPRNE